jgi:hypothetical protein
MMLKPDIGISPFDAKTGGQFPTGSITMFFLQGRQLKNGAIQDLQAMAKDSIDGPQH